MNLKLPSPEWPAQDVYLVLLMVLRNTTPNIHRRQKNSMLDRESGTVVGFRDVGITCEPTDIPPCVVRYETKPSRQVGINLSDSAVLLSLVTNHVFPCQLRVYL